MNRGAKQGDPRGDADQDDARKNTSVNGDVADEGTNKTQPEPDPQAKVSDLPRSGKHMERSPFVRGGS